MSLDLEKIAFIDSISPSSRCNFSDKTYVVGTQNKYSPIRLLLWDQADLGPFVAQAFRMSLALEKLSFINSISPQDAMRVHVSISRTKHT